MPKTRFGIEEEFMLLSPAGLVPVAKAEEIRAAIAFDESLAELVAHEFLASQIEYSSPVFASTTEAYEALGIFRSRLGQAAHSYGVAAAGTGIPFNTDSRPVLTKDPRYSQIRSEIRALVKDHQMNAVHVHVNVPTREEGIRALNGVRPWLPVLLALGSNSPFWRGNDTGFASWRSILARRWPTTGCPPSFRDAHDYDSRIERLVAVGAATDRGCIAWNARLSERFPTLEIRVFDAQLDAASTVLLAALARALVVTALEADVLPEPHSELLDGALWKAARDGVRSSLVNPFTDELANANQVVAALLRHVGAALDANGDTALVIDGVEKRLHEGSGADAQRTAYRTGGIDKLAQLFQHSLLAGA